MALLLVSFVITQSETYATTHLFVHFVIYITGVFNVVLL